MRIIVASLLAVSSIALGQVIDTTEIKWENYPTLPGVCNNKRAWECRPCPHPTKAGWCCVCQYCIDKAKGKTVENSRDLRTRYCKPCQENES